MKQNKHKTRSTGKAIQFFSFFNFPSISTILSPKSWRKTKPQIWHQAVLICRHLKVVSLCCHMSMTSDVCKTKLLTLYFYISNFPSCWQTFEISVNTTQNVIYSAQKIKGTLFNQSSIKSVKLLGHWSGVRFPKATMVASSVITNRVQWDLPP